MIPTHTGLIEEWDEGSRTGLIAREDVRGGGDILLTRAESMNLATVRRGLRVRFAITAAPRTGRPMATNVRLAEPSRQPRGEFS